MALDKQGASHAVVFTRAVEVQVFVDFELTTGPNYVGDTQFREAIATLGNRIHSVGETVIASRIRSLPFETDIELDDGTIIDELGVVDVVNFDIGIGSSPALEANIPIGPRRIARFEPGRIVVT